MAKRKKRRGNGEGGYKFHEKRNKWIINYTIGRDPKTGKQKRKTASFDTEEEAIKGLRKALYERDFGLIKTTSNLTFGEWITHYIENVKANTAEITTVDNYRSNVNNHVIPALGRIKLSDLTYEHLEMFYGDLYDHGHLKEDRGLSPSTVQRIHVIISMALSHAVKTRKISVNVAREVERRKCEKFETFPYSADELYKMLQVTKDDRFYAAYVVSAMTGLRRGEVLGLRWSDIDLDAKYLKVRKSVAHIKENKNDKKRKLVLKNTKTAKSKRTVPIDDFVVAVLKEHRTKQKANGLSIGCVNYNSENMVFCDQDGNYVNPNTYSGDFRATLKAHGLRHVRLHDLRHTYATLLLKLGVGHEKIRDLLGHSTVVTTLDIYAHVDMDDLREAVSLLSQVMDKKRNMG